jgi:hypothetical protein
MEKLRRVLKSSWALFVIGLLLGALVILAIRFVTYKPVQVHYHANFAVYINSQREEFKGPQFYQEVAACSSTNDIHLPQQRAHMHDNINSVVHVHDHAATWGQFFENFDWYVGPDFIETDNGTKYIEDDSHKLNVVLNGQDYTGLQAITNMVIKDRDRLLISYGPSDKATIDEQYKSVPASAKHYDETKDPASCAGSEKVTTQDRLRHLF